MINREHFMRRLPESLTAFSVYRQVHQPNVMNIFTEKPRILAFWAHRIEQAIIDHHLHSDMYVGFQKLSRFPKVASQYARLAVIARHIWIFGEADAPRRLPSLPNLTYVMVPPEAQLSREWFVVAHHEEYARALVAQELTPAGTVPNEREFRGLLTSDAVMIEAIARSLSEVVRQVE